MTRSILLRHLLLSLVLGVALTGCRFDLVYFSPGARPSDHALYVLQVGNASNATATNVTVYVLADLPLGWAISAASYYESTGGSGALAPEPDPGHLCQMPFDPSQSYPLPAVPPGYQRVAFSRFAPVAAPGEFLEVTLDALTGPLEGSHTIYLHSQIIGTADAICNHQEAVTVVASGQVFSDGFESGATVAWSTVVGEG
jgi:hypothetical protein